MCSPHVPGCLANNAKQIAVSRPKINRRSNLFPNENMNIGVRRAINHPISSHSKHPSMMNQMNPFLGETLNGIRIILFRHTAIVVNRFLQLEHRRRWRRE